ncbi:MAG: DUF177 domain-containing protein [Vicinamibacterales bacterium]
MLFDLRQIHGERAHIERTFDPSVFEPADPEYRVETPVGLSMDIERSGTDVFKVSGRVLGQLELDCGRCVEPFHLPVDATFELRYVPQTADSTEPERQLGDDELTTAFYSEGVLDVIDLVREQFQLVLPMKPLCREECKGLCPECGTNLNRGSCECAPRWEDPRLAALKSLLDRQKES